MAPSAMVFWSRYEYIRVQYWKHCLRKLDQDARKFLYADGLTLVGESLDALKAKLEAWK